MNTPPQPPHSAPAPPPFDAAAVFGHAPAYPLLIADAGSTKTEWAWQPSPNAPLQRAAKTQGINPFFLGASQISSLLETELLPQLSQLPTPNSIVYFGAGCSSPQRNEQVASALRRNFGHIPKAQIHVGHDLEGACRVLCGTSTGIACILGTGSNSALWSAKAIAKHTPSLGYLLGDEGSGAWMGKALLQHVLHHTLPEHLQQPFAAFSPVPVHDLLAALYANPFQSRFLASFAPFLAQQGADENVPEPDRFCHQLVMDAFRAFITTHLVPYERMDDNWKPYPVHAVGGIASAFQKPWRTALLAAGFMPGSVRKSLLFG